MDPSPAARTIQMFKPTDVSPIKVMRVSLSGNLLAVHLDPGTCERRRAGAAAAHISTGLTNAFTMFRGICGIFSLRRCW